MQPSRQAPRKASCAAVLAALTCLVLAFTPIAALAHGGGTPSLLVPGDHVVPGESFTVQADDFDPAVALQIAIKRDSTAVDLGHAVTDVDGHANVTVRLPASYPFGHAEVIATGDDGTLASTWIRVGDSTYMSPGGGSSGDRSIGSAAVLLAVVALGILIGVRLLVVGGRRRRTPGS